MKFKVGQFNFEITVSSSATGIRLELIADTDQPNLKMGLSVSYWQGAENPLVVKAEVKTENNGA